MSENKTEMSAIEQVLINGNLSQLNSDQRLTYYNTVCQTLKLNPLTKPFEYLQLNGKLVLYAGKKCAEQLRQVHKVSIISLAGNKMDDLYVVTCQAKTADGRFDCSTGAVAIGNLKAEALANAVMKAETKAKNRVTLSLCGLGMLDDSELDTMNLPSPTNYRIPTAEQTKDFAEILPQKIQTQTVIDNKTNGNNDGELQIAQDTLAVLMAWAIAEFPQTFQTDQDVKDCLKANGMKSWNKTTNVVLAKNFIRAEAAKVATE